MTGCLNPYNGGEIPPDGGDDGGFVIDTVDPAFWFEDIYNDMLAREPAGGFPMGQVANCKYVCDLLKLRRPNSPFVPVPGTENEPANCEYLLNLVDEYNDFQTGRPSDYGSSQYATHQIIDTIAVDKAIDMLYGMDGKYIMFGKSGQNGCRYSLDGISWTQTSLPNVGNTLELKAAAYGNGLFVMVGYDGSQSTGRAFCSTDGITWTRGNMPAGLWNSVTYGNGKFVAMGNYDNIGISAYSIDGINWTQGGSPGNYLYSVVYGNGKFVAVGNDGFNAYSIDDGITWTRSSIPQGGPILSVAYGKGMFVAVGGYQQAGVIQDSFIFYSTDGITWTRGNTPAGLWNRVAYGNGRFVIIGRLTNIGGSIYSTDGMNWVVNSDLSETAGWAGITYGKELFRVIGTSSTSTSITAYSADCINWTQLSLPGTGHPLMIFGGY